MGPFSIFFMILIGIAGPVSASDCFWGASGERAELGEFLSTVPHGSTLFLGELHGESEVAQIQMEILKALREAGHTIDVGMEFFSYDQQSAVEAYRRGEKQEGVFLQEIGWGGVDFSFYREQTLFPRVSHGERTLALNAPRSLSRAVAKKGLAGLDESERQGLPPEFTLGRPEYWERFRKVMGEGHVEESALQRYFEAQSLWDDAMAWQLSTNVSAKTRVVVVGEFHVRYGGGLPYRLAQRAPAESIRTLTFIGGAGLSKEELQGELQPHAQWGPRSDLVCVVGNSFSK